MFFSRAYLWCFSRSVSPLRLDWDPIEMIISPLLMLAVTCLSESLSTITSYSQWLYLSWWADPRISLRVTTMRVSTSEMNVNRMYIKTIMYMNINRSPGQLYNRPCEDSFLEKRPRECEPKPRKRGARRTTLQGITQLTPMRRRRSMQLVQRVHEELRYLFCDGNTRGECQV